MRGVDDMKKKIIFVGIFSVLLIVLFGSIKLYSDRYYAQKLIREIKEENMEDIVRILDKNPSCINTFPYITAKLWRSPMNLRVTYPLTEACYSDNIELIKLLLERGADVNCNDGVTPLSATYVQKGENWYEISVLLIESGADLNYVTAYSGNHLSILQDIVESRSGGNAPDYIPEDADEVRAAFDYAIANCDHTQVRWMRVLQHSITFDRIEIVKFLLDEGYCDVNDTSVEMTALMFAARDSTPEMVQLLLDYGADKSIKDPDGKTAYDYAVKSDNKDIIAILEN